MDTCAFCQIVSGERDAYRLSEDERTVAFLDSNPAVRGHTLVVPKTHSERLFSADPSPASAVFETVRRVALAMERSLGPDGTSIFYTSADLVGHITHAHVHVVPRYRDDSIQLALARGSLDEDDAARVVARIREEL